MRRLRLGGAVGVRGDIGWARARRFGCRPAIEDCGDGACVGQAYRTKDPSALARILDEEFVCVSSNGRVFTKADILSDVKTSDALQLLMDSTVVRLHGDTAMITGIFLTTGVAHGKPFIRRERFVDTWIYRNGQWVSVFRL